MKKMKIVCVADHFLTEQFYRDFLKLFPDELELISIPYFGSHDREGMRVMAHQIEQKGSESYDPPAQLFEDIKDADILMTHLCPIPRRLLEAAPNLKYILSNRGGLENIDLQACADHGIPILHNPAHNGNAVAEMTICLMVAETRNICRAHEHLKNGDWFEEFPNFGRVYELRRKTIGLIGFGTIGRLVAEKLQPFNVNILATDIDPNITPDDEDVKKFNVTLTDLDTLLKESDVVSLHARNSGQRILGAREFGLMKPTASFINTARAYMVDYDALLEVLRERRITGAALEVFPHEPLTADSPFIKLDNVTLTNHRGGDTVNCYSDSPEQLVRWLIAYLDEGKRPKFFINEKGVKMPVYG